MGNVIPFDGVVTDGEAMVNQASLTGESEPVRRISENYVYAGTVVEEGELTILVKAVGGSSRYDKVVQMIEESQKLKSGLESRGASGGSSGTVFPRRHGAHLPSDPECDKGAVDSDGGFLLRIKACHADLCIVGDP